MIYYAHHKWKYNTRIEQYEENLIRSTFYNEEIFNPKKIDQSLPSENIMEECLTTIIRSDKLVFSSVDGFIGKGVYREIEQALSHNIPVFYITHNKVVPLDDIIISSLPTPGDKYAYANIYEK